MRLSLICHSMCGAGYDSDIYLDQGGQFRLDIAELDIPNVGCHTSVSLHLISWKLVNLQAAGMSMKMQLALWWIFLTLRTGRLAAERDFVM